MRQLLACVILLSQLARADWPQWRGPDGQGHAGVALPVKWSPAENIAWRAELPGRGWSSPVIGNGIVWMTTALETSASPEESERRLKGNTNDQPLRLLARLELRALGVEAATGRLRHNVLLLTKTDPQWVHQLNSYASPSPVLEKGRLYCHFGTFGTVCLDTATRKIVWTNEDPDLQIKHENGPGSSPVVEGNRLIFHLDGSDRQFVAALDLDTGRPVWQTARSGAMHDNPQFKKSYGTPLVITANGRRQLISPGSDWLYAYDPATGKELWKLAYGELGYSLTPRPVYGDGVLYMATGFGSSRVLAVKIEGEAQPSILWSAGKGAPTQASPLLVRDRLYLASETGIVTCLNTADGSEIFRERLGEPFSASPTYAAGLVYFPGREGTTFVLKDGPAFEKVAANKLDERQFASFAADAGVLFLRTEKALYRIEEK
jgi:outer membrane protein assembly factor BamB